MLTRQALRDKAMQGMLDVLADAGTKSDIKVTAGVTLMDMLLKDVQLEEHEARVVAYRKLADTQQEKGPFTNLDPNIGHATGSLNSGRLS